MCVAGVSLCGSPERPLHEAVKEKPGLCWIPQDVTDASLGIPAKETCRPEPVCNVGPAQEREVCCSQQG